MNARETRYLFYGKLLMPQFFKLNCTMQLLYLKITASNQFDDTLTCNMVSGVCLSHSDPQSLVSATFGEQGGTRHTPPNYH